MATQDILELRSVRMLLRTIPTGKRLVAKSIDGPPKSKTNRCVPWLRLSVESRKNHLSGQKLSMFSGL